HAETATIGCNPISYCSSRLNVPVAIGGNPGLNWFRSAGRHGPPAWAGIGVNTPILHDHKLVILCAATLRDRIQSCNDAVSLIEGLDCDGAACCGGLCGHSVTLNSIVRERCVATLPIPDRSHSGFVVATTKSLTQHFLRDAGRFRPRRALSMQLCARALPVPCRRCRCI